ncbi:hypothetical protein PanWU01x14_155590 [Parasponia andersonii]|uniref:Uncharacterized protein n=1 Tax=Parasponia andersonii TaxID=3476 RepID=A0A2P5CGC3_PARAD|nr:hypothetical protein PanWU01x14_155590 [Parasponia andersonii]
MTKSRKLYDLITEQETNPYVFSSIGDQASTSAPVTDREEDDDSGGDKNQREEYFEDNLISKIERYLSQSVLKSLKYFFKAPKSSDEKLMQGDFGDFPIVH